MPRPEETGLSAIDHYKAEQWAVLGYRLAIQAGGLVQLGPFGSYDLAAQAMREMRSEQGIRLVGPFRLR